MYFNSLDFCIRFLPIFLIAYLLIPNRFRNFVIIAGGAVFYGFFGMQYLPVFLGILIINFLGARFTSSKTKVAGFIWAAINIALLVANRVTGFNMPGGSYLLFEMIALQIDVAYKRVKMDSFISFMTYGLFFPKVIMGPITKYGSLKETIKERKSGFENVEKGLGDFILGLAYKVLLADTIGGIGRGMLQTGTDNISFVMALLSLFAISLQIYYDFHGYSLMAKGIARMLGFELMDNFDAPYSSRSITEFYRRWHISLGSWFKDYVYIPMGGSRKGMGRTIINLLFVWLLTGLWHGLSWNFVLWGLFLGFMICLEKLFLKKALDKLKFLSHVYVWIIIPVSWVMFMTNSVQDFIMFFRQLFSPVLNLAGIATGASVYELDFVPSLVHCGPFMAAGILFLIPAIEKGIRKNTDKWWDIALLSAAFIASLYYLMNNISNPFMYIGF